MAESKRIKQERWNKVDIRGPNECWLWTGAMGSNGYGSIHGRGPLRGTSGSHRVLFCDYWGVKLPSWLFVLHDCPGGDNRACCNPAHLWLGEQNDNIQDMKAKGRSPVGDRNGSRIHIERVPRGDAHYSRRHPEKVARGERHGHAKLNEMQVCGIMARYLMGIPQTKIAVEFGVGKAAINDIVRGRNWAHLFAEI